MLETKTRDRMRASFNSQVVCAELSVFALSLISFDPEASVISEQGTTEVFSRLIWLVRPILS